MKITKVNLKEAFEMGMRHDFRPTFSHCFNRWYNEKFVDSNKCLNCIYTETRSKTNYKICDNCIDCCLFIKK